MKAAATPANFVLRLHTLGTSYAFCASSELGSAGEQFFTIKLRITQLPVYPNETSDSVSRSDAAG